MAFALVPSDCIGIISVYVNASQLDWSKNKTSNQIFTPMNDQERIFPYSINTFIEQTSDKKNEKNQIGDY